MKKNFKWLCLLTALAILTLNVVQADHPNGLALRQNASQLMKLAEDANANALNLPVLYNQDPAYETFALLGMTQNFYSLLDRLLNSNLSFIERHLNFVASQIDRTDSSLRRPDAGLVLASLGQMRLVVSQIRSALVPPPPPLTVSISFCKYKGNDLVPDLVIDGQVAGVDVRKATVYFDNVAIGDLMQIGQFYAQNPSARTQISTILFHQKFRRVGHGSRSSKCTVVAVDGAGGKAQAITEVR